MYNCGCNTWETKAPLLTEGLMFEQPISKNLLYHIQKGKPITENTFRYGSSDFITRNNIKTTIESGITPKLPLPTGWEYICMKK